MSGRNFHHWRDLTANVKDLTPEQQRARTLRLQKFAEGRQQLRIEARDAITEARLERLKLALEADYAVDSKLLGLPRNVPTWIEEWGFTEDTKSTLQELGVRVKRWFGDRAPPILDAIEAVVHKANTPVKFAGHTDVSLVSI
jgi:hypothetical protein